MKHDHKEASWHRLAVLMMGAAIVVGCGSDDPTSSGPGSGGAGAGTAVGGGGGAEGGATPTGGMGGMGGAGGAGGGQPTAMAATAPEELNAASNRLVGDGYTLTFQFGRAFHQPPAANNEHELMCAAPTHAAVTP
jgi:hypothetical protein